MKPRTRTLEAACACGARTFSVRVDRTQEVGLVTCARGHHALLLDSRDYWHDVIQDTKPKEVTCRCKRRSFAVALDYTLRAGSPDVQSIDVRTRCTSCRTERVVVTFGIDYGPTTKLLRRPLDPIETPWLKAKHTSIIGYWVPSDVAAVVTQLEALGAVIYVAASRKPPVRRTARQAIQTIARASSWDLLFAARELELPAKLRDCWKRLPVIHLGTPTRMNLESGAGTLYYLEWAPERLRAGRVEAQAAAFLQLADRVRAWLPSQFTAKGKGVFHNPAEAARLRL